VKLRGIRDTQIIGKVTMVYNIKNNRLQAIVLRF
jgi:hypothetical protein